jgi:predicted Zn-dependent protease
MLALAALVEGDSAAEQNEAALANRGAADVIRFLNFAQANRAAGHGQINKSQQILAQVEDISRREGLSESQAQAVCTKTLLVTMIANNSRSKLDPASALVIAKSPSITFCVADAYAAQGNDSAALKLIDQLSRERPQDTWYQQLFFPAVRARIEMNHGNGAKAIELLKGASSYDKANAEVLDLRGQAFLLNHQPQDAEKEFELAKKLQNEGGQDPHAWLAQLHLARAYAMEGNTAKARTAYQDFLAIWKDADPDLPLLTTAKGEYAKLQ